MPVTTWTPPGVTVVDGDGIIDLTALEAAEAGGTDAVAGTLAADPVTAPLVLEAYLAYRGDQFLINYKPWRNFWMAAGRDLSGWLANAGGALFGTPSDTVTHEELRLAVNLGVHTGLAATRQLFGSANGRLRVTTHRLVTAVNNIAHHVRTNKVIAHSEALAVDRHAVAMHQQSVAYTAGRVHDVGVASGAYTDQQVKALQQWTISHVAKPLSDRLDTQMSLIDQQRRAININNGDIAKVAGSVAALGLLVHQLQPAINKLLTEAEQCTEPMCETVGPKSDWGKLLKKFGPAAIWALLAEMAALHPDEVERVSESLAHSLGPVLEHFAESWIGVLPGGTGTEVKEVEAHVGKFNPLGLGGV